MFELIILLVATNVFYAVFLWWYGGKMYKLGIETGKIEERIDRIKEKIR